MVVENLQDLMEDRLIDLSGIPEETIKEHQLEFLLDDEYIVPEGIFIYEHEVEEFKKAQKDVYEIFTKELTRIISKRDFDFLGLPNQMIDLIIHSWEKEHTHLIGRFDFAGGINGLPVKLLEFNADMPTMLPESVIIQEGFNRILQGQAYSELSKRLEVAFNWLSVKNVEREKTILGTSLGHDEDKANLDVLLDLAHKEGFETQYADLPDIEFAKNEGVFVTDAEGNHLKYDYLLKLIPWEFICFDEPNLLDDLHNLILNDLLYVLNPAYTLVFQSKAFLAKISENQMSRYLLKTTMDPTKFQFKKHVRKVTFGRLGENITIFDSYGKVLDHTKGDFDGFEYIYQEFARLYKDQDGDYYQPGIYNVNGAAAGMSFRRAEKLIVDDDCQFIPHLVKSYGSK